MGWLVQKLRTDRLRQAWEQGATQNITPLIVLAKHIG